LSPAPRFAYSQPVKREFREGDRNVRKSAAIAVVLTVSSVLGCGQQAATPVGEPVAKSPATVSASPAVAKSAAPTKSEEFTLGLAAPGPLVPMPQPIEADMEALQPVPAKTAGPSSVELAFGRLLAAMEGGNPDDWATAEQELQAAGVLAVPVLQRHLEDERPQARELAVMFLAQIGPAAAPAAPLLMTLLDDPSSLIQVNAAATLVMIGDQPGEESETSAPTPESAERVSRAIETLQSLLDHPEENVRMTAISSLGNAGPAAKPALRQLRTALGDVNSQVRATAAAALGRLGPLATSQVAALKSLTKDEAPEVRTAAALAIRQIESPDAPGEAIPASATEK
jgi:hypothetical protein